LAIKAQDRSAVKQIMAWRNGAKDTKLSSGGGGGGRGLSGEREGGGEEDADDQKAGAVLRAAVASAGRVAALVAAWECNHAGVTVGGLR
jgi:hypothetical protein